MCYIRICIVDREPSFTNEAVRARAVSVALAQLLRNEMDYVMRRRAARALRRMACSDTVKSSIVRPGQYD